MIALNILCASLTLINKTAWSSVSPEVSPQIRDVNLEDFDSPEGFE